MLGALSGIFGNVWGVLISTGLTAVVVMVAEEIRIDWIVTPSVVSAQERVCDGRVGTIRTELAFDAISKIDAARKAEAQVSKTPADKAALIKLCAEDRTCRDKGSVP
jgi:hypothetical protein